MTGRVILGRSGIVVQQDDGATIALDPSHPVDCDFTFVSHAHVDHLHKRGRKNIKTRILASRETTFIAHGRGYEIADAAEEYEGFQLVDTGHILGSRGLLIGEGDVYYTGDISVRERAFMKGAKMPRARTLIIESTFGRPEYIFPEISEVTHRTNKIISEMYDLGKPVILMGYSLGKAQLLTRLFSHWDPIIHDSVHKINSVYSELGVELSSDTTITHSQAQEMGVISRRPWVMVAPLMSGRSAFVKEMKEKYGAITIGFSGWAIGNKYRYMTGLDYVMPLSDHCDYEELVSAVKRCRPDKVYTFHGFATEFAESLCEMGFDAEPVYNIVNGRDKKAGKTVSLDSFR
ncbi:MAG TPA: MBL fold metallo-hydrolase [Nitrososphaera sp.]|nr:MBL fold metallo-hydrolase [Nitrososphaera sp.]